jgi:transposase-like protein
MYTVEFKREAVSLITKHGYSVSEAARNLGLHANMLRKWKRTLEQQGESAFPGNSRLRSEQEELHRLRQENKRLRMDRDILKKAALFFCQRGEMRYEFIAVHHARWPLSLLCEVMQVSRSGLYADLCRHRRPRDEGSREALLARVRAISRATRHSYGSRRMAKQLQDEGYKAGRYQARSLMRQANVRVERPRRRLPVTTDSRHGLQVAPNVLTRQFDGRAGPGVGG